MMIVLISGAVAWMIINAVMLWCCCAVNRRNSLSRCATAPCIADKRKPDEKDSQNTER